ncbi:BatA domain-containing protein [uncultured Mucilaginibacter sp.]|uniref:BatA domain-containing protein n=1 Tax=uncultured Mucilaginibacter sp. TaxID=797541 RepID=UPI00260470F1|nr:BatA domain-containing protein [uncultured Mucilaginibacter sp.]
MLQLLNPLWLWAMAAISIAVLIHLWHIKTGKTLRIGSIALLGESARQSSRSFRINDWLLLLLRCLLLIVLSLLLTQPFWQEQAQQTKAKGWILVEKEPIKEVYAHFKTQIDSLLKAGYQLHQLDTSFKAINLQQVLNDTSKTAKSYTKPRSYWPLLTLLEQQIPQKTPTYLFTSNQLQHFRGAKPALNSDLHWKTYTPADSVATWIQNAFLTSKDSIRLILGESKPAGTSFSTINLQSTDRGNSRFNVSFEEGKPVVSLKNKPQNLVLVDTSTLKITVYQNQNPTDAAYLNAALQSVKRFTGRKMKITTASSFNQIPENQNWIFWLSSQSFPLNSSKLVAGGSVFEYENGKTQAINSWINNENLNDPINLYQQILPDKRSIAATTENVWQNGFGQSVLSRQNVGNKNIYRFYSRFNLGWNDLVWSSDFPKLILNLLLKSYPQRNFEAFDKRKIAANQQQIVTATNENPAKQISQPKDLTDLKHAFWIALFIVFLLERILALQTKKESNYA